MALRFIHNDLRTASRNFNRFFSSKQSWPVGGDNSQSYKESWGPLPAEYRGSSEVQEYESMFEYFKPNRAKRVDLTLKLHNLQRIDLRIKSISKYMEKKRQSAIELNQAFNITRLNILGYDLAAAHFMLAREGKVKFVGSPVWINEYKETSVPLRYVENLYLEGIDASSTLLLYEGLENFENLKYLKILILSKCEFIDDFCIDRVCGLMYNSLEYLDISHCKKITERGIIALARLRKLRYLNLTGFENLEHFPLICMSLEDSNPQLYIEGSPNIKLVSNPINEYIE